MTHLDDATGEEGDPAGGEHQDDGPHGAAAARLEGAEAVTHGSWRSVDRPVRRPPTHR